MSRGLSTDATVEDLDYHIDQARDMLRYVQNDPSFTAAEKVRFAETTRGKIANFEWIKERLLAASNRSSGTFGASGEFAQRGAAAAAAQRLALAPPSRATGVFGAAGRYGGTRRPRSGGFAASGLFPNLLELLL